VSQYIDWLKFYGRRGKMGRSIDLNCDGGESFGIYKLGNDEEMMTQVTSISIGCGFHGGDPHVMRKTVAMAKEHGVAVGAHPGFPDPIGFGRRKMETTPEEAIKPEPIFLALYNTLPYELAESKGIRVAGEFYADLEYAPDGTTFIKKVHGDIDVKATVEKVVRMVVEGKVTASNGKEIEVRGKSICFHGDNPKGPEIVRLVKEALVKKGVKIESLATQFKS